MRTSDSLTKIAPALTKARAEMSNPAKTHTANIKSKSGASFKYSYAGLPEILDAVRPVLAKNKLAVTQSTEATDGHLAIVTTILHESGEWIESEALPIAPLQTDPRQAGIAITYGRRYSLNAMLGLAPDDDTDGGGFGSESGSQGGSRQSQPQSGQSGGQGSGSGWRKASEKQVKCIYGKGGAVYGQGAPFDEYKTWLKHQLGIEHLEDISAAQAKTEIDRLVEKEKEMGS